MFVLITVSTVLTKLIGGRLGEDWLHSVLHAGSALLGGLAGWSGKRAVLARWYTWGIGLVYGALGIGGWFLEGLLLGTAFAIPLGPADNLFHLLLSVPALVLMTRDVRHRVRMVGPRRQ